MGILKNSFINPRGMQTSTTLRVIGGGRAIMIKHPIPTSYEKFTKNEIKMPPTDSGLSNELF
jgi:hypothetical protein